MGNVNQRTINADGLIRRLEAHIGAQAKVIALLEMEIESLNEILMQGGNKSDEPCESAVSESS